MEGTKRREGNLGQVGHHLDSLSGNDIFFEIERANTQQVIVKGSDEQLLKMISELKPKLTNVILHKSESHNTILHAANKTETDIMKKELAERSQGYHKHYEPVPRIWSVSGLPLHLSVHEVLNDLLSQGIIAISVMRLTVKVSDSEFKYPNLLVYLESKLEESKIDKEQACCNVPIMWKKIRGNILRCFRCQKYNHSKPECPNNPKCINCAGEHWLTQCPKKSLERFTPKCCNCQQGHWADSPYCPVYQKNLLHVVNHYHLPREILFSLPLRSPQITETDGAECEEICRDWLNRIDDELLMYDIEAEQAESSETASSAEE